MPNSVLGVYDKGYTIKSKFQGTVNMTYYHHSVDVFGVVFFISGLFDVNKYGFRFVDNAILDRFFILTAI